MFSTSHILTESSDDRPICRGGRHERVHKVGDPRIPKWELSEEGSLIKEDQASVSEQKSDNQYLGDVTKDQVTYC